MDEEKFLELAIEKARESVASGGFPAGAIVVRDGAVVGEGVSIGNKIHDPTSHGEMAAIRDACKSLQQKELTDAVLYSSMQPCLMCLGAIFWSGIRRVVYACAQECVSSDYYGGRYHTDVINSKLLPPIELIHCAELEEESLLVVRAWEASL